SSDRGSEFGHLFDVDTALTYLGWYVDQSLLGMRVFDVMRAVEYAFTRGDVKRLEAVGRGAGALWTMMAAVFEPRIQALRAERMLASYRLLAESDRYAHGASSMIKDVLMHGDLPQIAALATGCKITMVEPVDAMKRRV
ncbi:MAG: hypothetical protein JNK48_25585, partial [Bryobacterales bacterium]|nr:hypothetical protein [Bryobacterales bacterium]